MCLPTIRKWTFQNLFQIGSKNGYQKRGFKRFILHLNAIQKHSVRSKWLCFKGEAEQILDLLWVGKCRLALYPENHHAIAVFSVIIRFG